MRAIPLVLMAMLIPYGASAAVVQEDLSSLPHVLGECGRLEQGVRLSSDPRIACLGGPIDQGSYGQLVNLVQARKGAGMPVAYVVLRSERSDRDAARWIAELIAAERISTITDGACLSGCANPVFVAGERKYLGKHAVLAVDAGSSATVGNRRAAEITDRAAAVDTRVSTQPLPSIVETHDGAQATTAPVGPPAHEGELPNRWTAARLCGFGVDEVYELSDGAVHKHC